MIIEYLKEEVEVGDRRVSGSHDLREVARCFTFSLMNPNVMDNFK